MIETMTPHLPPPDPAVPVYVTTDRIATILGCHRKTVASLGRRGLIPSPIDLGGIRRWDLHAVLHALATVAEQ